MKSEVHRNNLDTLRLLFAVPFIFRIAIPFCVGAMPASRFRATHGVVNFGPVSVWAFFAMSGFLTTGSWQRLPRLGRPSRDAYAPQV